MFFFILHVITYSAIYALLTELVYQKKADRINATNEIAGRIAEEPLRGPTLGGGLVGGGLGLVLQQTELVVLLPFTGQQKSPKKKKNSELIFLKN